MSRLRTRSTTTKTNYKHYHIFSFCSRCFSQQPEQASSSPFSFRCIPPNIQSFHFNFSFLSQFGVITPKTNSQNLISFIFHSLSISDVVRKTQISLISTIYSHQIFIFYSMFGLCASMKSMH